jgi:hypothetical protein
VLDLNALRVVGLRPPDGVQEGLAGRLIEATADGD